jgi:drug/metabolite transporter (DMT)-like permease
MVVALAVAAALFYGAADFCGGLASRRSSTLAVVVWSQASGLLVLLPALALIPGIARPSDVGWGLASGISGAFAIALLYRGLAIGVMGVVSPITAVLAAAIPVAFGIAHGEWPAPPALIGIVCALAAVVLVSAATPRPAAVEDAPLARAPRARRWPPGIPEALGSGAAFGFFFIALAQTHADAGLYPLLGTRLTSLAILGGFAFAARRPLRVTRPGLRTIVVAGGLDMSANILYVLAAHAGPLSIAAVITSLYPAGTVALAAVILHERLGRVQWLGVAVALAGVVCLSASR